MGKLEYNFNPATSYNAGKVAGLNEGYKKAREEVLEEAIKLFCDNIVMVLAMEDWAEGQIQEMSDRICAGVAYGSEYPEDYAILRRKTFGQYNLHIEYSGKRAMESMQKLKEEMDGSVEGNSGSSGAGIPG